jgi:16S rRNA (guanine527-N7)-methyltransferase
VLTAENKELLVSGAAKLSVALDCSAMQRFELFADRLQAANKVMNLTRVPAEQTVQLHFLDSLTLCGAVQLRDGHKLLDMGTGAGFPGIPLAIAFPSLHVTLVDATQKRLKFIHDLILEAEIRNVSLIHGRAEELASSDLRHAFDVVTARAVAKMEQLVGWLIPFVAPGGCAAAYKSENARAEIEASKRTLSALGGKLDRIAEVKLPGTQITRLLAIVSLKETASPGARKVQRSVHCLHVNRIDSTGEAIE